MYRYVISFHFLSNETISSKQKLFVSTNISKSSNAVSSKHASLVGKHMRFLFQSPQSRIIVDPFVFNRGIFILKINPYVSKMQEDLRRKLIISMINMVLVIPKT